MVAGFLNEKQDRLVDTSNRLEQAEKGLSFSRRLPHSRLPKGEVVPVYEDNNGRGTDYRLAGFRNVQTDSGIKIFEIRDEITLENHMYAGTGRGVYESGGEFYGGYENARKCKG